MDNSSIVSGGVRLCVAGGIFRSCRNRDLFVYPSALDVREQLSQQIRGLVCESGLTAVDVFFANYGHGAGPGVVVPLAESTLALGMWPERDYTIDYFFHYCERGTGSNWGKVRTCIALLATYVGANGHTTPDEPTLLVSF